MAIKTFPLRLAWSSMLTNQVRHLAFDYLGDTDFNFISGQFITLLIEQDGKTIRRSYSIATCDKTSKQIEIACSYVEGGIATALLSNLKEGQEVTGSGPFGRLILREEQPGRYIMVATGTGITPYRAMLADFPARFASDPNLQVVVMQGTRHLNELLYADEFLDFAKAHPQFSFYGCLSREPDLQPQPHQHLGYVQTKLKELSLVPTRDIIYLCGNPNMIDDTFEMLKEAGFDAKDVRREKYISS